MHTHRVFVTTGVPIVTLLLMAFVLSGCGGLRASMVTSLPEVTQSQMDADLPKMLADVKSRPNVRKQTRQVQPDKEPLFLAPVVYNYGWDFDPANFPSSWNPTLNSGTFQTHTDWVQHYLREGLKSRSIDTLGGEWLARNNVPLSNFGVQPTGIVMLDRTGAFLKSYTFAANKFREMGPKDYPGIALLSKKKLSGGIYIKVHGVWDYYGHVKINGEPVVIYDVSEWFEVTVCNNLNGCNSTTVGNGAPIMGRRGIPSDAFIDKKAYTDLAQFSTQTSARMTAETVLAILDAMLVAQH